MEILGLLRAATIADLDAVQYYRVFLPLRNIDRYAGGAKCITTADAQTVTDEPLANRDVYVVSRMYSTAGEMRKMVDWTHEQGAAFVFDSDDDLTEKSRLVSGNGEAFIGALQMADYVTVSTEQLAECLGKYTDKAPIVLPNHIDCDWFSRVADGAIRQFPGLVVGLSGSPTHWADWRYAAVALGRIADRRCSEVTPLVQGDPPDYVQYINRLHSFGVAPYLSYPLMLAQFDVLLCAVDRYDPFNYGKSMIKPLEAMMAGALPVCGVFYQRLADEGAPVVIVPDDGVDGWMHALETVLSQPDLMHELRAAGRQWVTEHYDIANGWRLWHDAYSGLEHSAQPSTVAADPYEL